MTVGFEWALSAAMCPILCPNWKFSEVIPMKKIVVTATLTCAVLLCLAGMAGAADGPRQVAGFVLGDDIAAYKDTADLMSALPIRYAEYLREVIIKDVPGVKTGQIYYGVCQNPGKILRIRLKYSDSSKKFFEDLLERPRNASASPPNGGVTPSASLLPGSGR